MRTLSAKEACELLASKGTRNVGSHKMTRRVVSWPYCARCGLVGLKNAATRRALRSPCIIYE